MSRVFRKRKKPKKNQGNTHAQTKFRASKCIDLTFYPSRLQPSILGSGLRFLGREGVENREEETRLTSVSRAADIHTRRIPHEDITSDLNKLAVARESVSPS